MSLKPGTIPPVPEETARIARAAFPKGNLYMTIRDEIGIMYDDQLFAPLFPPQGQPAYPPWRLALICIMQFIEGLSDRQTTDAVRSRIDWKYLLGLDLADSGFDFSVLSEFRTRLIAGGLEQQVLDTMLRHFQHRDWLKARGNQRTDSTHVMAAIRTLNRVETVGETLRAALNAIAAVAPAWLRALVDVEWFDRYSQRIEEFRLPKGKAERQAYAAIIGADGAQLLDAIYAPDAPLYLRALPIVETLRQVWLQQYVVIDGQIQWRTAKDLPPAGQRIESPYDPEARYGNKRSTTWSGYKVHITETCDDQAVHLITHVETTEAPITDSETPPAIHAALSDKDLLPQEHLLDAGYVDAELLCTSPTTYGVTVIGPVRPDVSWQAKTPHAYDLSTFSIDWEAQQTTCPQGHTSSSWSPVTDRWNNQLISVKFAYATCRRCPVRALCTKAKTAPRHLTLRQQAEHEQLQALRQYQRTPAWKKQYDKRAGIEGTVSQGVRTFELRKSRYIGLAKTHLQHIFTAAAINLVRMVSWIDGVPHATTRTSHFAALASNAA